jgi:hypothetical protein
MVVVVKLNRHRAATNGVCLGDFKEAMPQDYTGAILDASPQGAT